MARQTRPRRRAAGRGRPARESARESAARAPRAFRPVAEHGEEAEDELAVAHAEVRLRALVHLEQVLVRGEAAEEVRIGALVDAVAELLVAVGVGVG